MSQFHDNTIPGSERNPGKASSAGSDCPRSPAELDQAQEIISLVILPIPDTARMDHREENLAAARLHLPQIHRDRLDRLPDFWS